MTTHIYAVLDADGVVINRILIEQGVAEAYWPGYGAKLADLGPAPPESQPPPPPGKDPEFGIIPFVVTEPVSIGDTIDPKTGIVTKKPVEAVAVEGAAEAVIK